MNITLSLAPETERQLRERAAQDGKSLEEFLVALALDWADAKGSALKNGTPKTAEQRVAAWWSWIDSHPAYPRVADDSRESIYAGRGE